MELEILKQAVLDSRDGITISDYRTPDNPLIFVNPAFERMTGYPGEEITQLNCRYLQSDDRAQPEREILRNAVRQGEHCLVTLRNYRKNGTMFWNELSISPIFDREGALTHFIGIQKDVTTRVLIEQQLREQNQSLEELRSHLEQLATKDGLTGIYNRRFFDAQFDIQWRIARRNGEPLTLMMIDIDHFKEFNDVYGHPAGDRALRRVTESLNQSFLRASDFVARYGGEEFVMLSAGMTLRQAAVFAEALCERVRNLQIPHAASSTGYLTISVGFSAHIFTPEERPDVLLEQADQALYTAKRLGRNRWVSAAGSSERSDPVLLK